MDTKNFLMSKTFQGLIVMVLTIVLPKLGLTLGDAEMQQLSVIVIQALAALWIAIGRVTASKGVSLGSGAAPDEKGFVRSDAVVGLCVALAIVGFSLSFLGGCALKSVAEMSGPERARVVAQEFMLTWKDAYTRYKAAESALTGEELQQARSTVAPAINRAKTVVIALSSAADLWSITADSNATAAEEFAAISSQAGTMLTQIQDLLSQLRR